MLSCFTFYNNVISCFCFEGVTPLSFMVPDHMLQELGVVVQQCAAVKPALDDVIVEVFDELRASHFLVYFTDKLQHGSSSQLVHELDADLTSLSSATREVLLQSAQRHFQSAQDLCADVASRMCSAPASEAHLLRPTLARARMLFLHSGYLELRALHLLMSRFVLNSLVPRHPTTATCTCLPALFACLSVAVVVRRVPLI